MLVREAETPVISPVLRTSTTSALGLVLVQHLAAEYTEAQLLLAVIADRSPALMLRAAAAVVRTRVHAVPAPLEAIHEAATVAVLAAEVTVEAAMADHVAEATAVVVQTHAVVEVIAEEATEAPEVVEATAEVLHPVVVVEAVAQEAVETSIT